MRTTVTLDDELYATVRAHAADSGSTVSAVVEEALRLLLAADRPAPPHAFELVTFGGSGLQPGATLSGYGALLAAEDADRYKGGS